MASKINSPTPPERRSSRGCPKVARALVPLLIALALLGAAPASQAAEAGEGQAPAVVRDPTTGAQTVYYVNAKNEVADYYDSPVFGWTKNVVGGKVKENTSLTAVAIGSSQYVYYVNNSGEIANWTFSEGKWTGPTTFGGKVASTSSPWAILDPSNNFQYVYYVNNNAAIANWTWAGSWSGPNTVGGTVKENTSPTATLNSAGQYVYWVNSSGQIANWTHSSGKWIGPTTFGGEVWANTSPTSILDPTNNYQYVYYFRPSGGISSFTWTGSWTGPHDL